MTTADMEDMEGMVRGVTEDQGRGGNVAIK